MRSAFEDTAFEDTAFEDTAFDHDISAFEGATHDGTHFAFFFFTNWCHGGGFGSV